MDWFALGPKFGLLHYAKLPSYKRVKWGRLVGPIHIDIMICWNNFAEVAVCRCEKAIRSNLCLAKFRQFYPRLNFDSYVFHEKHKPVWEDWTACCELGQQNMIRQTKLFLWLYKNLLHFCLIHLHSGLKDDHYDSSCQLLKIEVLQTKYACLVYNLNPSVYFHHYKIGIIK